MLQATTPCTVRETAVAGRNDTDNLLIAVGAHRDRAAFALLFGYFGPRVHAYLRRHGLDAVAAAEVTQDVMETIWRKAHLFDRRKSSAATWVFRVARNRQIDLRRRSREDAVAAEDLLAIPDPRESSDVWVDTGQREERVRDALAGLPPAQLTLVRLAFFEGLSHSAIAERTKLPLGTVKSRIRLAFSRLRRLLGEAGVTGA
jgi:RNA polymerase sigma-70 factor (ECF subfamily)